MDHDAGEGSEKITVDGILRESLHLVSRDDHIRPKRRCPGIVVERPITFRGHLVSFDRESQSRTAFKAIDWYYPVLDRYLEVGYSNEALVSVFRRIPDELARVLKQSLQALQILRASEMIASARTELDLDRFASTGPRCLDSILNDGLIGDQGTSGLLHVFWDPVTQVSLLLLLRLCFGGNQRNIIENTPPSYKLPSRFFGMTWHASLHPSGSGGGTSSSTARSRI
jgi:hypothetical protein